MWKGTIFEPCMAEEDPKEHTKIAFITIYFAFPKKKKGNVYVEEPRAISKYFSQGPHTNVEYAYLNEAGPTSLLLRPATLRERINGPKRSVSYALEVLHYSSLS